MIYIFPKEIDITSEKIFDWIINYKVPCKLLFLEDIDEYINSTTKRLEKKLVFVRHQYDLPVKEHDNVSVGFTLFFERREVVQYFFNTIKKDENCKVLNLVSPEDENKMQQLAYAEEVGFDIPKSILANQKEKVISFFGEDQKIITKTLHKGLRLRLEKSLLSSYTSSVDIQKLSDHFFPSLFQEHIVKEYEIRVFYFNNSFYSIAILSQNNEQTKLDFRNYDYQQPNRMVPYEIPPEIKRKIHDFMKKMNLISGSIDIVKSEDGKFIFLEVNPHGHFGFTSENGNYNIEKEVAKYLIDEFRN